MWRELRELLSWHRGLDDLRDRVDDLPQCLRRLLAVGLVVLLHLAQDYLSDPILPVVTLDDGEDTVGNEDYEDPYDHDVAEWETYHVF